MKLMQHKLPPGLSQNCLKAGPLAQRSPRDNVLASVSTCLGRACSCPWSAFERPEELDKLRVVMSNSRTIMIAVGTPARSVSHSIHAPVRLPSHTSSKEMSLR